MSEVADIAVAWQAATRDRSRSAIEQRVGEWNGWYSDEAAIIEGCPNSWIRRARVLLRLDPDYGEQPIRDARVLEVVELHHQGVPQGEIAARVGLKQPRISKILNGSKAQ